MHNYILFMLILCLITFGHIMPVEAQKIELEAPPLLWEEAPKEQKYDDKDYWKRKYGLRKKGTTELEKEQMQQAEQSSQTDKKAADGDADAAKTGAEDESKSQDSQSAEDEQVTEKKPSSVVVDQAIPPCDFDWAMGVKVEDIDFEQFGERPVRIVYSGQKFTKDVNFERINLRVASDGTISKIACF